MSTTNCPQCQEWADSPKAMTFTLGGTRHHIPVMWLVGRVYALNGEYITACMDWVANCQAAAEYRADERKRA